MTQPPYRVAMDGMVAMVQLCQTLEVVELAKHHVFLGRICCVQWVGGETYQTVSVAANWPHEKGPGNSTFAGISSPITQCLCQGEGQSVVRGKVLCLGVGPLQDGEVLGGQGIRPGSLKIFFPDLSLHPPRLFPSGSDSCSKTPDVSEEPAGTRAGRHQLYSCLSYASSLCCSYQKHKALARTQKCDLTPGLDNFQTVSMTL